MKKIISLSLWAVLFIWLCNGYTYYCYDGKYPPDDYNYDECIRDKERTENFHDLYFKWSNIVIQGWNVEEWIKYLEEALEYADEWDKLMVKNMLWQAYYSVAHVKFQKTAYPEAIDYYKKYLKLYENDADTLYNIGVSYVKMWEYKEGIDYLKKAKKYSLDLELDKDIDSALSLANELTEITENMKTQVTNDKYNYRQTYLSWLNIYAAWELLPKYPYSVTIAVIDDWVNINHPDLTNNIWTNSKEIPWNWIDDDKNWYIDDYNGWNFFGNVNSGQPNWSHGTMVAWIIAAKTNNSIWIAWITPSVKIMPLIVFDYKGDANANWIINAIDYAIDNWADIINLSLWWSQFEYTDIYDRVFQKAYDNWVIVVIAAWNWDVLSNKKSWVNTSVNSVSPVCNKANLKNIIWVGSLTKKGNISDWSNYGDCIDFYAFGEWIYSTTINSWDDPYTSWTWTSFSAPIVAGIIWLWYNKYWKINPENVYNALKNSTEWNIINAEKYLKELQGSAWELSDAILWMNSQWLTIYSDPINFMAENWLRRDEAAKFFVQYAKQVMWKIPNYFDTSCKFNDLNKAWPDLKDIVVESCQLWLFQWHNGKFMPTDKLTNAQAITVFMRLIDWYKDETWTHYANEYYKKAQQLWLLSWTPLNNSDNFDRYTTRWDVAKMLFRWQKQ